MRTNEWLRTQSFRQALICYGEIRTQAQSTQAQSTHESPLGGNQLLVWKNKMADMNTKTD
jgi:hypothetical protein